ncbi:NUDIX domain-containing protein [Dyadobacter arcticus]|uniref:ADP-ribose pyrophosphatase YjhB (NUDIX family) n=1 Tax=Dyadobacter arcticus TaxID=1078754 RepID=A0ABX0USW0_9BACT|nr:NUDIX domain-containing protein [Dyadobacter arcticus]NIJ56044.1 ADP-ribose pyrophosphatase YjhB (NUDIX family) [Dyadobacter arcticus]
MNVRPSALIIKRDRILTLRYNYGDKDVYALPGGNPDAGECLHEALKRELDEELGVITDVNEMIICGEVIWKEIQKETFHVVFETKIFGTPALNPAHTTALEIVWLPIDALNGKVLYPNIGRQIEDFCEQLFTFVHIGVIEQPYIR